jgi:nitrogen PTS system EIIA component
MENMPPLEILTHEAIAPSLKVNGKKQALQEISAHAARLTGVDAHEIFETLLQRERLGSTGIGEGIAIPHGKLASIDKLFGFVARLEKPIDFEAIDGMPVDFLFLLLAPETAGADHLKALARVARVLRQPGVLERLRAAHDADAIYAVLMENSAPQAA